MCGACRHACLCVCVCVGVLTLQAISRAASEMKAKEATIVGLEEQLELARTTLTARTDALQAVQHELSTTAAALEAVRYARGAVQGGFKDPVATP
jgi:hypothetical protein